MVMRLFLLMVLFTAFSSGGVLAAETESSAEKITFVCEHGIAKSVIAAALFNREAASRGLKLVAQARGVEPEDALQPETAQGLRNDGLDVSAFTPARISPSDVEESKYVITLGVAIEPEFVKGSKLREWDAVPPVSSGYTAARDAISIRVMELIGEVEGNAE
jgi:arsenate reductase